MHALGDEMPSLGLLEMGALPHLMLRPFTSCQRLRGASPSPSVQAPSSVFACSFYDHDQGKEDTS
jgi:hypothetical protein